MKYIKKFTLNETKTTLDEKIEKLKNKSKEESLKLIWGWIKQDSITLKEFIKIIDGL